MQFSASSVLGRAFAVLKGDLPVFVVIALLIYAPVFLVTLILGLDPAVHQISESGAEGRSGGAMNAAGQVLVGGLAFLAQYVLAGAVTYAVLLRLAGRTESVADASRSGLLRLLPVVDVAFVTGIAVGSGLLLLVVPGIVLACVWFVAVPAAVVEGPGVVGALRRSRDLTRGHRPAILAVVAAILGLMLIPGLLVLGLFGSAGPTLAILLGVLLSILVGLVGAVSQAVAYHDLRVLEEGVDSSDLIPVND